MDTVLDIAIALLLFAGGAFSLIGSIGLAKLSDFFKRLHGPTKASTLGVGCILVAAMLFPLREGGAPSLREVLITVFLFMTAPVSAHMLAKAAVRTQEYELPPKPRAAERASQANQARE